VWDLGLIEYQAAYAAQFKLAELRYRKEIEDVLLVMEHPPTVTLGKFGKAENVLADEEELSRRGVEVCRTNRGGDTSFHCPGQLVVYPIMDMRARRGELRRFMHDLEQTVIDTARHFGIYAERWQEHPGVWAEGKQLAAIGLHFTRGISMHGISLNINPELDDFKIINLCGIPGKEPASITSLSEKKVTVDEVKPVFLDTLSRILDIQTEPLNDTHMKGEIFG
jgi:lipoate-protein ligase B